MGSQRLYRPHVEDIAFLFLRRALPLPWSLPRAYIRRLPSTTSSLVGDVDSSRIPVLLLLAGCYLANGQMRLVRFTRIRSVMRPIGARSEAFSIKDRSLQFFISIRLIVSARTFFPSCRYKYRSCLEKGGENDAESRMIHSAGVETCDFVEPVQIRDYLRQKDSIYSCTL